MQFLETGQDVRRELRRIFQSEHGRRVAVVAFVGYGAEAYLPRPKGIELVCWNRAPGTNPRALHRLKNLGVQVSFAKKLHMKVYWTEHSGAILASANLSTNAYGRGARQEAGVLVPSRAVPIEKILSLIAPHRATEQELKDLDEIYRDHLAKSRLPGPHSTLTFRDWSATPSRKKWFLYCFETFGGFASRRLREAAREERPGGKVEDFAYCRRGELKEGHYLLCVKLHHGRASSAQWMFAHRIVQVNNKDTAHRKGTPYQIGQLLPSLFCPPVPFRLDGQFRKSLVSAYRELGEDAESEFSLCKARAPSKRLLTLLGKHYNASSQGPG
jgi:hypothetical protein